MICCCCFRFSIRRRGRGVEGSVESRVRRSTFDTSIFWGYYCCVGVWGGWCAVCLQIRNFTQYRRFFCHLTLCLFEISFRCGWLVASDFLDQLLISSYFKLLNFWNSQTRKFFNHPQKTTLQLFFFFVGGYKFRNYQKKIYALSNVLAYATILA